MKSTRIISLVPSITLLLFDLGLEKNIVGRTKFCIHPEDKVKGIPTIGGTKNIDLEKIKKQKPDLIIANHEENEKEQIEALQQEFNVLVTDVRDLDDNYKMIAEIGAFTGTSSKAKEIIDATKKNFEELRDDLYHFYSAYLKKHTSHEFASAKFRLPALYLIWRKPYMTIGHDTFIHSMMETIGLQNIFEEKTRYPVIEDLRELDCGLVLLSSEPYPFTEKHIDEIQQQLPGAKILLVDGEFFSWYGSRMIAAPAYFRELLQQFL